jgi:hypothetical protein
MGVGYDDLGSAAHAVQPFAEVGLKLGHGNIHA